MNRLIILLVCSLLLASCITKKNGNGIDFEVYKSRITDEAGENAFNCGHVGVRESLTIINECVFEKFNSTQSFYAIYDRQGIDSSVSEAITFNDQGSMLFISFDSDISGGSSAGGSINPRECKNPVFVELDEDDFYSMPFDCQE